MTRGYLLEASAVVQALCRGEIDQATFREQLTALDRQYGKTPRHFTEREPGEDDDVG